MNRLKQLLGVVWFLLAPILIFFLLRTALDEIEKKPVIDTKIQWGVFVLIFLPIAVGLMIFGYYAWKGEYNKLPTKSDEIA